MQKIILFSLLIVVSHLAQARIDLMQSPPAQNWFSIENDSVQLIYPEVLQPESTYIANLVDHYSHFVGQTYGIEKPKKFSLILRSDVADPNAFVTLAPRRSEWFTSSAYNPSIGSAEWYQILSVHEYRHVNQFDFYNQSGTKVLYYIMGEMGENVAAALGLSSWYMEGDAVWTETKYTDSGRGRSPRFLARLKALVLSDRIPTFDEFLSGSYRTSLPNQYVYGYALISYGTQKYGEDFWPKIVANVARLPIPLRLYTSFYALTHHTFEEFYNEAMQDLKNKWKADAFADNKTAEYQDNMTPHQSADSMYYLHSDLDHHTRLMKKEKNQESWLAEVPFSSDVLQMSYSDRYAVTTEYLPDSRYAFKGSSDLILYELKNGAKTKLTSGERIYNPDFNSSGNKIIAVQFRPDQSWNIVEFDLQGKQLNKFSLPDMKVSEAHYLGDDQAIAIINAKNGMKFLAEVNLKSHQITKTILPPSRNVLNYVRVDAKKNIFFEAQYKGHIDIFKISPQEDFSRCTQSKIAAEQPSSDGQNLFYSQSDINGSHLEQLPLTQCQRFPASELVDYKYLDSSPSDNYNGFPVQTFPEQSDLGNKNKEKYHPEPYGDLDRQLFIPHSWGLFLGRNVDLGVQTDNYLHTMEISAETGTTPEEGQGFGQVTFDLKKYFPIFEFQAGEQGRKVDSFNRTDNLKWNEKFVGLSVLLPLTYQNGYQLWAASLAGGANYTGADKYHFDDADIAGSNYFYKSFADLNLSWNEALTPRSIIAPWLLSYRLRYDEARQPSNAAAGSHRSLEEVVAQAPTFWGNDGFKFSYDQQKNSATDTAYRFLPETNLLSNGYTFSRGYSYFDVSGFQKFSANYLVPLAYPDWNCWAWLYLKRINAEAFFDSTYLDAMPDPKAERTLNSYGLELQFESTILRILPLTIGGRALEKMDDNGVRFELFTAIQASY